MKKSGGKLIKASACVGGLLAAAVSSQVWAVHGAGDNLLFFRGGYTELVEDRAFNSFTDTHGLNGINEEDSGWYVGAGFDFQLTKDVWGLVPGTWVVGELGLEYNNFGTDNKAVVVPTAECNIPGDPVCIYNGDINVTMLTISASPKIKFLEGSPIRPWIIPVGLDIDVISPPSDSATVLDVGMQFGAGVDWELIPGVYLGIDGRYHYAADYTDSQTVAVSTPAGSRLLTVDTDQDNDHWNVGGYLGIGF